MAISMAGFTFNDALTKSVTAELTVAQIMFIRGAFTALLVYVVARRMGALDHIRNILQPLILLRIAFETIAAVAFLAALGQVPLANASAILQSLPLAVTLGAALFYREPVGWRRWTAIASASLVFSSSSNRDRKGSHWLPSTLSCASSRPPGATSSPAGSIHRSRR